MCPPGGLQNPHPLAGVAQRIGAMGQTPPPETWQRVGGSPGTPGPMPMPQDIRPPPVMNAAVGQPPAPDVLPGRAGPAGPMMPPRGGSSAIVR